MTPAHRPAYLDAATIERLLPMADAIAVLAQAWRSARADDAEIPRAASPVPGGQLLSMPAASPSALGIKVVTVADGQPARNMPRVNGAYILFDVADLSVRTVLDAGPLTSIRTPAVSAVAASALAMADAHVLVVFGTGAQARGHVTAMTTIRQIDRVYIVGRRREAASALVGELRRQGLDAHVGSPDAVVGADIICTCTTSTDPVFDGRLLDRFAHVSAIGSFQPQAREVDDYTVAQSAIVVETRAAALAEAGDILIPLGRGLIQHGSIVADLAELAQGKVSVSPQQRTLFKSVGVGFEDLVIVQEIIRRYLAEQGR
jgi:ornithine cyclodeaminase/alanine dehydrogenase-like protein (mu-crystallin family)